MNLSKIFYLIVITIIGSTLYYISKDDKFSISNDHSAINPPSIEYLKTANSTSKSNKTPTSIDIEIEDPTAKELTKEQKIAQNKQRLKESKQTRDLINNQYTKNKQDAANLDLIFGYEINHPFTQQELKDLYLYNFSSEFLIFEQVMDSIQMNYFWEDETLRINFQYEGHAYNQILSTQASKLKHMNSGYDFYSLSQGMIDITEDNFSNLDYEYSLIKYDSGGWELYKQDSINELASTYHPKFNITDTNLKKCILDLLNLPSNSTPTKEQMLSILVLTCKNVTNVSGLESWNHLKGLDLSFVSSIDFSNLKNLNSLEILSIYKSKENSSISGLTSLTQLKHLDIKHIDIHNTNNFSKLTNLQSLTLHSNNIDDLSFLQSMTNLNAIDISDNRIKKENQLNPLPPNLNSVTLTNLQLDDLSMLKNIYNLNVLNARTNNIQNIPDILNFNLLSSLNLSHNKLTNVFELEQAHYLNELNLSNNNITDVSSIENLSRLYRVNLKNNPIISNLNFEKLYALQELEISENENINCEELVESASKMTSIKCE